MMKNQLPKSAPESPKEIRKTQPENVPNQRTNHKLSLFQEFVVRRFLVHSTNKN